MSKSIFNKLAQSMHEALAHAKGEAPCKTSMVFADFMIQTMPDRRPIKTHDTIHAWVQEDDCTLTFRPSAINPTAHKKIVEELRLLEKSTWAEIDHFNDILKGILSLSGFQQVAFDFANNKETWFLDKTPGHVTRKIFESDPLDLLGIKKIELKQSSETNRVFQVEISGLEAVRWGIKVWQGQRNPNYQDGGTGRLGVANGKVATLITPQNSASINEIVTFDLGGQPVKTTIHYGEWYYVDCRRFMAVAEEWMDCDFFTVEVMANEHLRSMLRQND